MEGEGDQGHVMGKDEAENKASNPVPSLNSSVDHPDHGSAAGSSFDADGSANRPRRSSYLIRHFRGELSLPVSYWINGFCVNVAFSLLVKLMPPEDYVSIAPRLLSTLFAALWPFLVVVSVWQCVGIFRSARNYLRAGKSRTWGNLARVAVVLGLISFGANLVSAGIPQVIEYTKIAVGKDPLGTYQIRVLREGCELEISGPIAFGLTGEVKRKLEEYPSLHIVHLNSRGGRVAEARSLRDLIASRGLTTYTASGCLSACTLAFAAGQKRLVSRKAILGFHQYSFPGLKSRQAQAQYEKDERDWLGRGFSSAFVKRAFETPNREMWRPSHDELIKAGFVTGYAEDDEVAVSGLQPGEADSIEAEFAKIPMWSALKAHEPEVYKQLILDVQTGLSQGKSIAELRQTTLPLIRSIFFRELPYASDSAIRAFTNLFLEQAEVLYSVDPALCYDYVMGENRGGNLQVTKYFSNELREKELTVISDVIVSAAPRTFRPPDGKEVQHQLRSIVASLNQQYGEDVRMLVDPNLGRNNKARTMQLTIDLYRKILMLPDAESGPLLRFMFGGDEKGKKSGR